MPLTVRLGRHLLRRPTPPLKGVSPWISGAAAFGLWLWVTRWMIAFEHTRSLTAAWSAVAFAVFIAGLALRERPYRLGGFAMLALAVGRVFFVDVWELETIYRIISFLALGVVLLALGYLYNRFSEQIRRWL
jgi:uncharacterized membrane protein